MKKQRQTFTVILKNELGVFEQQWDATSYAHAVRRMLACWGWQRADVIVCMNG